MYSKQIHDIFQAKPCPSGVICDLVDYGDYLALRFYRDNFDSRKESTRLAATEWAVEVAGLLNQLIPCTIEAWETPPEDK